MLLRLLAILILVPFIELTLLLLVADAVGFPVTFVTVVLTGALGAWLLRRQGLQVIGRIRSDLGRGLLPAVELVDAMLIVAAAALLLTPGLLTDIFGMALLFPTSRIWFRRRLAHWFKSRWKIHTFTTGSATGWHSPESEIIDSHVVRPIQQEKLDR